MNAVFYITFYSGLGDAVQRNAFYIDRLTAPWDEMEEHLAYCAEQFEKKTMGNLIGSVAEVVRELKTLGAIVLSIKPTPQTIR